MEQKILILAYNPYSFEDEKTHEIKEGLTIHYISSLKDSNNKGKDGYFPIKESVDLEQLKNLNGVGYYKQELATRVVSGKMILSTSNLTFIEPFSFKKAA